MITRYLNYVPRRLQTQVATKQLTDETFRTSEQSPTNHDHHHVGHYYTLNPDVGKQLFTHGGLPRAFNKQVKTFTETSIMVRKPALDIMTSIKQSDLSKPAVRYVLYGMKGTGKSLTTAHLLHFALESGFLIIHVPWVPEWLRRITRHKEMSNSASREGFVDLPLDAAAWLIHFRTQNNNLLKNAEQLVTSKEYVWSKRETTPAGTPLIQLIEHGVNRVKYASDVVEAVISEVKNLSNQNKCKTFVAIDGFNSFFYSKTRLRTTTKKVVNPFEVTLTKPFLDATKNDWKNAAILLTVDQIAAPEESQESYMPRYLLGKQGFEHLDPFVPISVGNYNDKEFQSCSAYYRNRLWLRGPTDLEAELKMASACNPYRYMELCAPL